MHEFHNMVKQLGAAYGLPLLHLDDEMSCVLKFNHHVYIRLQFDADSGTLRLFAALGAAQLASRDELLDLLLETNNDLDTLHGAWLAMIPNGSEVILRRDIAARDLSADNLPDEILKLAGLSERLRGNLMQHRLLAA